MTEVKGTSQERNPEDLNGAFASSLQLFVLRYL